MSEITRIGNHRFKVVSENVNYTLSRHYTKEAATEYLQGLLQYGATKIVVREIQPKGEVDHG